MQGAYEAVRGKETQVIDVFFFFYVFLPIFTEMYEIVPLG